MGHQVRYNPKGTWQVVERARGGDLEPVDQQEVWQQVGDDAYLKVTLERTPGFNSRVIVQSAQMLRGQQPNGKWRAENPVHAHMVGLVEDEAAQTSAPTAPKQTDTQKHAQDYIKDRYQLPTPKPRP